MCCTETYWVHATKKFSRRRVSAVLKSRGSYVRGSVVAAYAEMCVKSDCEMAPCSSRVSGFVDFVRNTLIPRMFFLTIRETMSAISLESVEVHEVTSVEDCWIEPEETLVVSLHEPYIEIVQNEKDEAKKGIEVISERLEEPPKESKEDQPLVCAQVAKKLCERKYGRDVCGDVREE
ncbi:hypothetical protein Sjap_021990 [Stephania japonica]|uniref:Uncharacterized protein n=1 Tax=Stephania japonica TaxID=461633 RepID=A0AAP0HPG6_9MAGN